MPDEEEPLDMFVTVRSVVIGRASGRREHADTFIITYGFDLAGRPLCQFANLE